MVAQEKLSKPTLISQLRLVLLIAIPLLVLVNLVVWSAYAIEVKRKRNEWLSQAEMGLDEALINLEQLRNDFDGDIRLLSNSPNLAHALNEANEQNLLALAAEWEVFAAIKRRYDQIRWVDDSGQELLRVNLTSNGAVRATDVELQDKSTRYYFRDAMSLQAGKIYASPIDLNVEHGKIERPFKPMLRLAVPLVDSQGRSRGLLLVNVLARFILDDLVRHANLRQSRLLMLDRTGYYLRGFEESQAWGFMLRDGNDVRHRFDKAYPAVWREIVRKGSGHVDDAAGLFVFRTVRYGSEGFGQRYILLEVLMPKDSGNLGIPQWGAWFSISLLVSLLLGIMVFYYVRCRMRGVAGR